MPKQVPPAFDAAFWFLWIMATSVGWIVGSLIFPSISTISAGVGVGAMQWAALYHRLPTAWRWPLITAATWIAGSIFILVAVPADSQLLLSGVILGPVVGIGQWLILRQHVYWAGWWIVISTMSWITGLTLLPGILATGAMVGAISGLALGLLLHSPRSEIHDERSQRTL
jgi:hypothetical protein